jgi:hypothetical protein
LVLQLIIIQLFLVSFSNSCSSIALIGSSTVSFDSSTPSSSIASVGFSTTFSLIASVGSSTVCSSIT